MIHNQTSLDFSNSSIEDLTGVCFLQDFFKKKVAEIAYPLFMTPCKVHFESECLTLYVVNTPNLLHTSYLLLQYQKDTLTSNYFCQKSFW